MAILSNASPTAKFVVVATLCTLSFSNGFQWGVFTAPINESKEVFGMTHAQNNVLLLTYTFVWIPCIAPSVALQQKYGPHGALIAGTFLNVVGWAIKLFVVLATPHAYWLNFIGQTLAGASEVFFLPLPSLVASTWFPEHMRSKACCIASLCNSLGVSAVFAVMPTAVATNPRAGFVQVFLWMTIIAVLVTAVILLVLPAQPAVAPSATASTPLPLNRIVGELKTLWRGHKNYVLFVCAMSTTAGIGWNLSAFIIQMLMPFGVTERNAGFMSSIFTLVGAGGQLSIGAIVDYTRVYKPTVLVMQAAALTMMGILTASLSFGADPTTVGFLCVPTFGAVFIAMIPLAYEYIVELTYPVPIAVPIGIYTAFLRIYGTFCYNRVYSGILGNKGTQDTAMQCLVITVVMLFVAFVAMLFVRDDCRRLARDREVARRKLQEGELGSALLPDEAPPNRSLTEMSSFGTCEAAGAPRTSATAADTDDTDHK